jgi:beta-glucanase (GH16 family)
MRKLLSALAVCTLPALAVAQNTNVLRNPGFEYDPAGESQSFPGWTVYGPTYGPNLHTNTYSESGPVAHGGANYIKASQDLTMYSSNFNGVYQDFISGPGAAYSADGWVYAPSTDLLAGQNSAWIEVTFRDANANVLALYRSSIVTNLAGGGFPLNAWMDLPVTNQYDPNTYLLTNTAATLVAPAGACFVRYQVVVRGNGYGAGGGSVYFDDLKLDSTGGTPYSGLYMVWSDEFNSTHVDTNTWTYDIGTGVSQSPSGWGNNELEYYSNRTNNVYEAGGLLHIVARRESYNGSDYTSARVKSQGLFSQKYGRIEWRAKLPVGLGCWPALWLLGTNITTVPWPRCGEIDMMENRGSDPASVQASLHSGSDETGTYQFISGQEADAASAFHIYTMDWSTNAMMFYVDGHLYETQTNWSSSVGGYPVPFNQPFFLIMNLAIGGSYLGWPSEGAINAGTSFPVEMDVDYLRIYQLTNTALVTPPLPLRPQQPDANSVLVDFNSGDNTDVTPSPANGFYWNNVVAAQTGGTTVPLNGSSQPIGLVNAANANSGMTLAITSTGWGAGACPNWADYNGAYGYPALLGDIPSTALRDGVRVSGGATMTVTLSGLNPGLTYNLLSYGANTLNSGGNTTDVGNSQTNTLTLGTSPNPAAVRFNAYYNSTTVVIWTNVTPGASGQIAFTITVPSAGSGGALNFMEVSPTSTNTTTNTPPPAASTF